MKLIASPAFQKAVKRLPKTSKAELDAAVRAVMANPQIGELKRGDLTGILVHKFKINRQEKLLAYSSTPNKIVLLALGSHENFYRDLKRQ